MYSYMNQNLQTLYTPHTIPEDTQLEIKAELFLSFEKNGSPKQALEVMTLFFLPLFRQADMGLHPFKDTYWPWFVRIVWENVIDVDPEHAAEVFAATFPYAVSQYIHPLPKYLDFFVHHVDDFPQIAEVHKQVAVFFQKTHFPVSLVDGHTIYLDTFCNDIEMIGQKDAIQRAEFLSRIERELFGELLGFSGETELRSGMVDDFISFVQFCIQNKDIEPIAREYFFRSRDFSSDDVILDSRLAATALFNTMLEQNGEEPINGNLLVQPFNVFTFIEHSINEAYPFSTSAPDQIIEVLRSIAESRENERVNDVYYYNESTGKFEWDEALLKELELVPLDFGMSGVSKKE